MFTDALTITGRGDRKELSAAQRKNPAAAVTAAKRSGGFVWLNLVNPDEDEMRSLCRTLKLHPLAAADAAAGRQQPKVQRYDEHLFVVMWNLIYSDPDSQIGIGEIYLFFAEHLLLTVQRTEDRRRKPAELRAVIDAPDRPGDTLMSVAYSIMSSVVDGYTEVSSSLEDELQQLETQVFDDKIDEDAYRIHRLRQKIGKVDRAVASLATALETSQEHFQKLTLDDQSVEPYLRDLLDDLVGTAALTADQSRALDGVVSTHENNVASRQNSDMRKISALAALLAIPTVTAGLYGMNFKNLPGVNWQFGWLAVTIAIVALDIWAFIAFKRRRWL